MLALQDIVSLLDRKFDFLMNSKREDFMLDLSIFIDFLCESDQTKDFTMKIYSKFAEEHKKYKETKEKEKISIIDLANKICKAYPEIDDSNRPFPGADKISLEYEYSFAAFNDIVNKIERRKSFCLEPDMMNDDSEPRKMLNIILNRIDSYERDEKGNKIRQMNPEIILEYNYLDEQRRYNFRKWLNSCRVTAGNALVELLGIISQINPEPKDYKSLQDRFQQLSSIEAMKSYHFESWIQDATYGVVSKYANYRPAKLTNEQIDRSFEQLKYLAKRVYEIVREEIGTYLLHKQVLNKYKTRSIWYNYEELWDLVTDRRGKFISKREQSLTLNLARFLFDNGVLVIYRLKAGQHEMDMVDPEAKNPLLIEVKVYKDATSKKDIIKGISQLHSYLNNLSATRDITNGFYVIYRFGGPLYDLPEKIPTNQFIINTILIDLGRSKESGKRQKKPIIITEDEIIENLKVNKYKKP